MAHLFLCDIKVYDGPGTAYPIIFKASGNVLPPVINGTKNEMLLMFITNSNVTFSGWRATYLGV